MKNETVIYFKIRLPFISSNTHGNRVFSNAIMNSYCQTSVNKLLDRDRSDYQRELLRDNRDDIWERFHLEVASEVCLCFHFLFLYLSSPLQIFKGKRYTRVLCQSEYVRFAPSSFSSSSLESLT